MSPIPALAAIRKARVTTGSAAAECSSDALKQRQHCQSPMHIHTEEFTMRKVTAVLMSIAFVLAGGSALAQDAMKKDAMGKDAMATDGMKKDAMKKGTMKKDTMAKDGMKKDAMGKDTMSKDAMSKDGMGKGEMKK
jgi:pentapeptide MXKDX repeat protein